MSPHTGTYIEITVRLGKVGLYWSWLKAVARFPIVLMILVPVGYVAFNEARLGQGFYATLWLSLFLFVGLPWVFILLAYRKTLLKKPVRYIFSDSGISTDVPPVSSFVEWSFAVRATENRWYILVFLKNGFVLLPKNQMNQQEIAAVRTAISDHIKRPSHFSN